MVEGSLSFRHKGTRSSGTHIVSILAVEQDGFRIDDPYGNVREDYNSRKWDDAYWGRHDDGHLIRARDMSAQRNVIGEQDNWGTAWAREQREEEIEAERLISVKARSNAVCSMCNCFTVVSPL